MGYLFRYERVVYGGEFGDVIGLCCVDEIPFKSLKSVREYFNNFKKELEPIGELISIDKTSKNYVECLEMFGRLE